MKKVIIVFLIILSVVGYAFFFLNTKENNCEYLRIHIRANSNLTIDQNIKYEVKNTIVDELYPIVANCNSKDELKKEIENNIEKLTNAVNSTLHKANLNYSANIKINSEMFPTRVYSSDLTLKSGIYDALIVELGQAQGDNWWCVIYPPLCFMNVNYGGSEKIIYKSRIVEQIKKFFS